MSDDFKNGAGRKRNAEQEKECTGKEEPDVIHAANNIGKKAFCCKRTDVKLFDNSLV